MSEFEKPKSEKRRFDVELLIVHPTLEPAAITAALGLEASRTHRVGYPRQTPKGTALPGIYPNTRWRHSIELTLDDQWFAAYIDEFIDRLVPHKAFLKNVLETGGDISVIIQFFDGYYGDNIRPETLRKLADLGVDFGIECFSEPQQG